MEPKAFSGDKLQPGAIITGSSGESPALTTQMTAGNQIFERFYFCKMKVLEKEPGKGIVRKNFWVFPPVDSQSVPRDEQEEADILSSFGFCRTSNNTTNNTGSPVSFIAEFFAHFRATNTRKFWFVLTQNRKQDQYVSEYNPMGLRNFFGMNFDDFEFSSESGKIVKTQSLFLIESKYPFRTFMFKILDTIFELVRVHRLSQYSIHFNGDQIDPSNLQHCQLYDSSNLVQTLHNQTSVFLGKLIHQSAEGTITATEDQHLSTKIIFKPDPMMADFYEAVESMFVD